jgi:hypothetical protein
LIGGATESRIVIDQQILERWQNVVKYLCRFRPT